MWNDNKNKKILLQLKGLWLLKFTKIICYCTSACDYPGLTHNLVSSLVAQTVGNLPPMQATWVRSLGWEDPLERKWQPTPVFLPGEFHGQRSLVGDSPRGERFGHDWATNTHTHMTWLWFAPRSQTQCTLPLPCPSCPFVLPLCSASWLGSPRLWSSPPTWFCSLASFGQCHPSPAGIFILWTTSWSLLPSRSSLNPKAHSL